MDEEAAVDKVAMEIKIKKQMAVRWAVRAS